MSFKDFLDKLPRPTQRLVLELDLARGVLETVPTNPLQLLQVVGATSMADLRDHLAQAATDERVAGLIVHAVDCGLPAAAMEEITESIRAFGSAKPTLAWAESFGEFGNALNAFKLAAACQQIWLQPTGTLGIGGVELNITLLKGMLNKAGIEPQFGQRHEYKTAADQFAAEEITPANREMTQQLGQSVVDHSVMAIAADRNLDPEQVWQAVNASTLTAQQALDQGFVDNLGYRDQVYAHALDAWQAKPTDLLYVARYHNRVALAKRLRCHKSRIAHVSLRGPIVLGRGRPGMAGQPQVGSDVVDEHLRAVLREDSIKAVIFEVDSPGGSAVASDMIRRSVQRVRESGRPVVAKMGTVAASGGYYVAMPCDEIVAQPTTLTGSIGVLAGKFVTKGLYDLLGLKRESLRVGAAAGMMSGSTHFTEEDWQRLNAELDRVYLQFTSFAAEDRGMAYDDLERLARGRVWTGADAYDRGLVDHLGGWRTAWRRACQLADLDPTETSVERIGAGSFLDQFIPARSSEHRASSARASIPSVDDLVVRLADTVGLPIHGALSLPWKITIR